MLHDAGLKVVLSGVQMPRMNSIMERWVQTCRHELLDRTLLWNHRHLLHALREYEHFYNQHRPHRSLANATPLCPLPGPITDLSGSHTSMSADGTGWAAPSTNTSGRGGGMAGQPVLDF